MQVVILCGGKGIRLWPYTNVMPKPLIPIGDKPIIYHIMKYYAHYGHKDFILCLGHLGEKIKDFFQQEKIKNELQIKDDKEDWNIEFVDTGTDTETGGRIKQIEKFIKDDTFFVTYGDGLSNLDLNELLKFHQTHGKIATLTVVKPTTHFGIVELNANKVIGFKEKPTLEQFVNGGFFVFNKKIFDYIKENEVLEKEVFTRLLNDGNLYGFEHDGFWRCMDTYKDAITLNEMAKNNTAEWMIWKK